MSLKNIIESNSGKCIACVKAEEYAEFEKRSKGNSFDMVFNVPLHLQRSKNKNWRQQILDIALAMAEVFTEQGLTIVDLPGRYKDKPEHFYIEVSELTAVGQAFVDSRIKNWFANMDRWKSPASVTKFKKSLELQYSRFKQEHS